MDHLEKNEGKSIIRLLSGLFAFANHKDGLYVKGYEDTESFLLKGAKKVFRDAKSSEAYIEEYLASDPNIKFRDQALLQQWKKAYKQELYLFETQKDYTYAYSVKEDKIYGIKGLMESLQQVHRNRPYPVLVEYAILPYKGYYICDAIDRYHDIVEGSNAFELYEAFRNAGIQHGVQIGEEEMDVISFVDREHAEKDDMFMEYLQPLLLMSQIDQKMLSLAVKEGAYAWNLSFEDEENIKEAYDKRQGDDQYIRLCVNRRKELFPHANFQIEKFSLVVEHGCFKIHIEEVKKEVEQLALDI